MQTRRDDAPLDLYSKDLNGVGHQVGAIIAGTLDQEPNRSGDIRTVDEEPNQFGELREAVPTPVMERPTLIPARVAARGKTFFF